HHRHFGHGRMPVKHILHFNGGNIFTAGNDDVLGAVADLDITILMPDRQVAGMEPATFKGLFGGPGVFQVALHDQVTAHHDLTHGAAIHRHRLHGDRVGDHNVLQ